MNRVLLGVLAAVFLTASAPASDESPKNQTQIIPLNEIWAYQMPGTRRVEKLLDEKDWKCFRAAAEAQYKRASRMKFKDLAQPGFVVPGSGRSALITALDIFNGLEKPHDKFSSDDEITVVFFSEPIGRGAQIHQVKRENDEVEIQYSLLPKSEGFGFSLALIPLCKLPVGKYHVEMHQLPRELTETDRKFGFKPLDKEWSQQYLCKPFNFTVVQKGSER